ncbi:MAG: hypothetical protein ACJ72O_00780 [Marmoricola sp.]
MDNRIAAACGVAVLLAGASACGSQDKNDATTPSSSSTSGPQTAQQGAGPFPGANGKVADVSGSTAQVQSQQDGQVAVTWTSSTKFTHEVAATLADVKVGDCVMVTPPRTDTSSSSTSTDDATVAAGRVRITATTGSCTAQLPGPGGGSGGPSFSGPPPTGAPDGTSRVRGSFGAFGKVTAVSGTGFTVSSTTPVTVSTSSSTTYTRTAAAAASDVKVGSCMNARGATDSTGALTATTIALSAAVHGECGGGFFRSRDGVPSGSAGTSTQAS